MPRSPVAIRYACNSCNHISSLQASFAPEAPLEEGFMPFPDDGQFFCPNCGTHHNLSGLKEDMDIMYFSAA